METQEYIVFALAGFSVIYLIIRFYLKRLKKKTSKSACNSACDCK